MAERETVSGTSVAVWDLPVRLFHWSLVVLLVIAWSTAQAGLSWMPYHLWTGYAILTLILFRLLWGIFGSRHARFSDFIGPPGAAWRYARQLAAGRHPFYLGHNPLGGYMVALLLTLVLIQVGISWMVLPLTAMPIPYALMETTSAVSDMPLSRNADSYTMPASSS